MCWGHRTRTQLSGNTPVSANAFVELTLECCDQGDKVEGKVKEGVGKVTGNKSKEHEGKAQHTGGKIENKIVDPVKGGEGLSISAVQQLPSTPCTDSALLFQPQKGSRIP